jgi:hypothetical protein
VKILAFWFRTKLDGSPTVCSFACFLLSSVTVSDTSFVVDFEKFMGAWEALRRSFPSLRIVNLEDLYPHAVATFNLPMNISLRMSPAELNSNADLRTEFPDGPQIDLLKPARHMGCDLILYQRTTQKVKFIVAINMKVPEQLDSNLDSFSDALAQLEPTVRQLKSNFPDALGTSSFFFFFLVVSSFFLFASNH